MLSRLGRQTISAYRQKNTLSCIQQFTRTAFSRYGNAEAEGVVPDWENENEIIETVDTRPWREKVTTELSDDAPVYPTAFESPERDLVNFPRPKMPEEPAQTRMIIFPENWFKFMYEKMGVSGPYTLGIGVFLFLTQKEILITHGVHWEHLCAWYFWWYTFTRTQLGNIFSYALGFDTRATVLGCREFERVAKEHRHLAIKAEKEQQAVAEGTHLLFETKKENVGLQLEAAYRESAMNIYNQVKRRLDYQVEIGKIDSRIKQEFMVNWVIDEVQKSLKKTSEADTLKQCLSDLNVLAAKVQKSV